jgi:hypothetical protein
MGGSERTHADETMAPITAERLVEYLERSGYVVMHKPAPGQHAAPGNLAGWIDKAAKIDGDEQARAGWTALLFPGCPLSQPE